MPGDLLIDDVHFPDGRTGSLAIAAGVIAETAPEGAPRIDGGGWLVLPGLIDAHMHLDKTFWGLPWQPHAAKPGERASRIEAERAMRRDGSHDAETQAGRLIRQASAMGTTRIRSHVDVDTEIGLRHVEAVLRAREAHAHLCDIELVAFPQSGLVSRPGTEALLEDAIRLGCAHVGGLDPSQVDGDRESSLDAVFRLAERTGAGVDLHLHEPGEQGAAALDGVIARTRAIGLAGRVVVGHAFCLGMVDEGRLDGLLAGLADAGIAIMTHAPGHLPFPPLKRLREAGVAICSGSDGVRDAWTPFGNADMLERAMLLAYRSDFRRDEDLAFALDIVTRGGATVTGAPAPELVPGAPGDVVLVAAETVPEAVVARPGGRLVVKAGAVVAG